MTTLTTRAAADRLAGSFVRAAMALGASRNATDAAAKAEREGAAGAAVDFLRLKAASPGAALSDQEWAARLADQGGAAVGFIESLRPASLFYRFTPLAWEFPMFQKTVACAALEVGGATAENSFLPVVAGGFDERLLTPRKTGGIVALSRELLDQTDPASFAALRRELQRAAVAAVDDTFLAVVLDAVTPTEAAEDTPSLADLREMLEAVATTGAERLVWMAGATMATRLATAEDQDGGPLFPSMSPVGGRVLNLDCMVSDRIAPGRLILADASGFLVNEGGIDIDLARGAALKMMTNPTDTAGQLVSVFQTGMVALRVVAAFGCERHRANAVAALDLPEAD